MTRPTYRRRPTPAAAERRRLTLITVAIAAVVALGWLLVWVDSISGGG